MMLLFPPLVRLNRGNYRSNGIVEIYSNKKWGTICASGFGQQEADVTCKILGYQSGLPLCCAPYGYSFRNTILGGVTCQGNEKHMTDCSTSLIATNDNTCFPQEYASVACYNGKRKQGKYCFMLIIRLNILVSYYAELQRYKVS